MRHAALLAGQRLFCVLLFLVFLFPATAFSLSTDVQVETLFRGFERDIPTEGSSQVLPGYGYLKFNVKDISSSLSLHGYGWGRYDMADSRYYASQSKGELLYGYVEYRKPFSSLRARLGRQHVFEGVANETLDGLWAAGALTPAFSVSGYAGFPVGLSSTNGRSGDVLVGGRVAYHRPDAFDLGVSSKFSNNDGNAADRMLGVDLTWYLPKDMTLYGFSKFNTDASSFAEHSWELQIPIDSFTFKPYLQYYNYDSYFGTGDKAALPFLNLAKSGEKLGILGLDGTWLKSENWNLGGKVKYYTYDKNDSSQYISAVVNFVGEEHTQTGGELGYMKGEAAKNNYLLLRIYTYQDQLPAKFKVDFISADLVYALYDQKIYSKDSSLFLSLGVGKHFFDKALDVKLSGDYSVDPLYSSDVKGMLSATYYFGRGF
ncbi:hypothetical protein [Geopsychrobacter electrodiphilus]|uniref:hypothetical protein n=1 Tax=Geopsychrobacter electrodiphilus TaxID=225196 RepID=UPI00036D5487|nr:hypothetical protein [Geopsychrobacter electrodiphilus]